MLTMNGLGFRFKGSNLLRTSPFAIRWMHRNNSCAKFVLSGAILGLNAKVFCGRVMRGVCREKSPWNLERTLITDRRSLQRRLRFRLHLRYFFGFHSYVVRLIKGLSLDCLLELLEQIWLT